MTLSASEIQRKAAELRMRATNPTVPLTNSLSEAVALLTDAAELLADISGSTDAPVASAAVSRDLGETPPALREVREIVLRMAHGPLHYDVAGCVWVCVMCEERHAGPHATFRHDADCPVLLARRLLDKDATS